MSKRLVVAAGVWVVAAAVAASVPSAEQGAAPAARAQAQTTAPVPAQAAAAAPATADHRAVLNRYCVTCHNERLKTADLLLDQLDVNNPAANPEKWEKVVRKLRVGMMPPLGMPRPDQATYTSLISHLETSLDRAPMNPGRPRGLHRMNRAEYANAIRDVLGLELDVNTLLPPDDSSYGFDNVADVLGVSPALQERYLAAATKISAIAVGDVAEFALAEEESFQVRPDATQLQHVEGLPLGTRGGGLFYKVFPVDGQYQFNVKMFRTNLFNMRGLDYPHKLIILLDGVQIFEDIVGGDRDAQAQGENATIRGDKVDARLQVRIPVKAGRHSIGVAFIEKTQAESPFTLQPFEAVLDHIDGAGISKIDLVKVNGPFDITAPGDTPSRRRIFVCRPTGTADEATCARTILSTLARRAYRRPVTDADLNLLMGFFTQGRRDSGNFDSAISLALRYILASPEFTFRVERDPAAVADGRSYRLSDMEIASRLSFFLWSSVPDDELLQVAEQGRLRNPQVLQQQVRRMLADPKAISLTSNFAGQYLYLRNLRNHLPNYNEFPDFDDNLRIALRTETEMLFKSIIDEDRNVLDLLNADYTFLNERLAKHYDIPNIYGSHFRRVQITDPRRRGILGQGSILTVTSLPNRTSPVKRGKWVLEQLLGSRPPDPPPGAAANFMPGASGAAKPKTMREEMEAHRTNATCAACHQLMDPIGFAMETFDGIGVARNIYPGSPSAPGSVIDTSGQLADGSKIDGIVGLRTALLAKPDNFVQTFVEKLMIYSLGRGTDYYDMPTIRRITRDAARNNYRFSSIVMGIVTSPAFEMRVKTAQAPVVASAGQ